jgi:CspA family cold shock protein
MDIVNTMSSDTSTITTDRQIGNVKWFNNKAGYGFITTGENTNSPKDIFVHYSNISVGNEQYKYLVQGEYVEFVLTPTPEGQHPFQATNVTGIQGGATLCERRRQSREAAVASDDDQPVRRQVSRQDTRRGPPPPSSAVRRPRVAVRNQDRSQSKDQSKDADGFTTVKKGRSSVARNSA